MDPFGGPKAVEMAAEAHFKGTSGRAIFISYHPIQTTDTYRRRRLSVFTVNRAPIGAAELNRVPLVRDDYDDDGRQSKPYQSGLTSWACWPALI